MQYAVVEMSAGNVLLDAMEFTTLQAGKPVDDEPADETAFRWHVAYGAFWPQPYKDPATVAAELLTYQGAAFGRITREGTCRLSEVRAIELAGMVRVGHSVRYPCAVLIGTIDEIPPSNRFALTLFPRFTSQMDPLTNTLNRPGVLALKGEEKRAMRQLNPDPGAVDWRSFIKPRRVSELALMEAQGNA